MSDFRPRLMIVDDEASNLSILLEMFGREYKIVAAKNGAQALKRALKNPPDLILMDVVMPEMDGYVACRHLKENEATRDIPIIFATGLDESADGYRGLELGGVDYIKKPYEEKIIRARIETHLRLSRKSSLLEELASLDPLTDIPNRRSFDRFLETAWNKALRAGTSLSLIMVSVDGFEAYGEQYGYARAGRCLGTIAGILSRCARRSDLVARYGEETFSVVLPETGREEGEKIGGLMLDHVREAGISGEKSPGGDRPKVSVSLGVAAGIPEEGRSATDMVELARKALGKAASGGGDRYEVLDLNA